MIPVIEKAHVEMQSHQTEWEVNHNTFTPSLLGDRHTFIPSRSGTSYMVGLMWCNCLWLNQLILIYVYKLFWGWYHIDSAGGLCFDRLRRCLTIHTCNGGPSHLVGVYKFQPLPLWIAHEDTERELTLAATAHMKSINYTYIANSNSIPEDRILGDEHLADCGILLRRWPFCGI